MFGDSICNNLPCELLFFYNIIDKIIKNYSTSKNYYYSINNQLTFNKFVISYIKMYN